MKFIGNGLFVVLSSLYLLFNSLKWVSSGFEARVGREENDFCGGCMQLSVAEAIQFIDAEIISSWKPQIEHNSW